MRQRLTTSALVLSITLLIGCAPKVAQKDKSTNPLAVSNWKLPSWPKKAESKKSESKISEWLAKAKSTKTTPAKSFASKEPSTAAKFSTAVKESALVKGVESAWTKTTDKLTTSPLAKLPEKMKGAKPSNDPVLLSTKTPEPNVRMHTSMAELLETSGQTAQAEKHYRQALAIDPKDIDALLGHAHLLDRQGELHRAVVQYQVAAQHHPNSARAFNDLGLCLARQNKLSESITALNRAVQLQPQRKLYRNNLATVLTELRRNDEAFAHLATVHGTAVAHFNMGYLLNQKGETQTAAYHFAEAAKADPNFAAARRWADHLMATQPAMPYANQADIARPLPSVTNAAQSSGNPLR